MLNVPPKKIVEKLWMRFLKMHPTNNNVNKTPQPKHDRAQLCHS